MAMMDSAAWPSQDQPMHGGPDDDFQQFLDMNGMGTLADGLQFDFDGFQSANGTHIVPSSGAREHMDTPMAGTDAAVLLSSPDPAAPQRAPPATSAPPHAAVPTTMIPPATPTQAITEIDAQIQYLQQQRLQQQQRQMEEQHVVYYAHQSRMIPPTPQSMELPPGNAQFYAQSEQAPQQQSQPHPQHHHQQQHQQQQQQAIYERFQRLKEQQEMAFTPLVSPAVTPLETHFPVDVQFTVPGAYFSPLTSPALHAQNDPVSLYEQRHPRASTSSPGEVDLDPVAGPSPGAKDLAKKARKNNAAKARAKGNVRQSPISKPSRRKTGSTPIMNAQVLSELVETSQELEQGRATQPMATDQASGTSIAGVTDSENGSVSPETLCEMPPPPVPKPRSARQSPYIQAQNHPANPQQQPLVQLAGKLSPATPASLMKLASPSNSTEAAAANGSQEEAVPVDHIESFELPESANFPKADGLTPINTTPSATQSPSEVTPTARGGAFQPLPSPVFAKPTAAASANQSPQLTPGSSSARRTPQMLPRNSKKRASIGSVQVSPALRPKISPNIKPLLPGGGSAAEDTASQLLAAKSNYQNILEGNKVPGVSYPSELSTNLTSKRTSHKIAEQGRRNRINSALQEIATLLPQPVPGESKGSDGEGSDKKDGKGGSTPSSKANTVEMAIEYIKQLREEVAAATRRAEEAELKLGLKDSS